MPPESPSSRKSVIFFVDDWWACAWYRANVPGAALKHLGYDVVVDAQIKPEDYDRFDVFVFQKKRDHRSLAGIQHAKDCGKYTVYELDDDIWSLSRTNPGYDVWAEPGAAYYAAQCIRSVDLVTTTTPLLAEKLRKFNPNVKVLPNVLPAEGWDFPAPVLRDADRIVLGWAGSSSHVEDLSILADVVPQILNRYPHVEFAYAGGPVAGPFASDSRMRRLPVTDIQHYPTVIENFDIGLIPLADSAFNRAKSDLKFVEYSMLGIPSVASKLDPYLNSIRHGENGFLATNAKDWIKFVSRLIESPELRLEMGERAQEFARARTIDRSIDKWIGAYGLDTQPIQVGAQGE